MTVAPCFRDALPAKIGSIVRPKEIQMQTQVAGNEIDTSRYTKAVATSKRIR
jgi:hypothetical protein